MAAIVRTKANHLLAPVVLKKLEQKEQDENKATALALIAISLFVTGIVLMRLFSGTPWNNVYVVRLGLSLFFASILCGIAYLYFKNSGAVEEGKLFQAEEPEVVLKNDDARAALSSLTVKELLDEYGVEAFKKEWMTPETLFGDKTIKEKFLDEAKGKTYLELEKLYGGGYLKFLFNEYRIVTTEEYKKFFENKPVPNSFFIMGFIFELYDYKDPDIHKMWWSFVGTASFQEFAPFYKFACEAHLIAKNPGIEKLIAMPYGPEVEAAWARRTLHSH